MRRVRNLRELKLLQHARMQNPKDANGVVLAAKIDLDSRGVTSQERRIYATSTLNF
jgi:hypothetical protein